MSDRPDLGPVELEARAAAAAWGVELGEPFALSRYSYVAPAGDDLVLKVIPPTDTESREDAYALELWAGEGAVRLVRRSDDARAYLMERARPGTDLAALSDVAALEIAVGVGRRIWRPAGAPFQWIGDRVPGWLDEAEREGGEGCELIPLARALYAALDVGRGTLVHGDFHHHNILRHGDGYVVIDSKAMLGEPEYDVPSFLWNPLGYEMTDAERTELRIAAFVAAGLDEARIRAWTAIRGAFLGATPGEAALIASWF